jgi:osomolarity two-component system sensor histidine kinase NIK1
MCSSLTDQVRSIAVVTTAVARGDLTQKIEIQVEGEMSTLKSTSSSLLSLFDTDLTRSFRYCKFHGRPVICVCF